MAKQQDGEFQRIDDDGSAGLGPSALLICGFAPEISQDLKAVLEKAEAADHRLVFCTPAMIKQPLGEALESQTDEDPAAPDKLPRTMVLSGMSGVQINAFLDAYRQSGLSNCIFATVTPANLRFPVGKLLSELLREQRAMRR